PRARSPPGSRCLREPGTIRPCRHCLQAQKGDKSEPLFEPDTCICTFVSRHHPSPCPSVPGDGRFGRRPSTMTLPIVFRQVRIFDGVSVLPADTVIIQEGSISAVGSHLTLPPSAIVIDGTGQTLLPGLIDAHTHTFDPSDLRQALIFGVT